jgi:hypothetical protein
MIHEFDSFYYQPSLLSSRLELQVIKEFLEHAYKTCAQSKVSEYLDLNRYTKQRSVVKCRAFLRGTEPKPFEFAPCLN